MGQNSKVALRDRDEFLSLDPGTRYCLVDTMVVLPIHQGDPDVIRDARLELHGATLILLDKIISEAVHKHGELEGGDGRTSSDDFVSSLSGRLESADIRFKFVRLGRYMLTSARKMFNDRVHPGLSKADYTLLLAAMKRQNMDVMTDDKALIGAINNKRGPEAKGRIRSAMSSYRKRRTSTAVFIKRKLGDYIPEDVYVHWNDRFQCTEFLIEDVKAVSIDHFREGSVRVDLLPLVEKSNKKILKIQSDLGTQIRKHFFEWKPKESERGPGKGPAQKKDWYRQHRDGDGDVDELDEVQMRSISRKLQNKRINDLDI